MQINIDIQDGIYILLPNIFIFHLLLRKEFFLSFEVAPALFYTSSEALNRDKNQIYD